MGLGRIFGGGRKMPAPIPLPPAPPAPPAPPVTPPPSPVLSGEKSDGNQVVTPTIRLGLNVHRLTTEHIALCKQMGVTQVRTTLYTDAEGGVDGPLAQQTAVAAANGFDVLVVLNGDPEGWAPCIRYAYRWLGAPVVWQLGNECESALPPEAYVRLWRATQATVRPDARLVTAAVGGADPAQYVRALLAAGCVPHAVAVHAYGPPPGDAVALRVSEVDGAIGDRGAALPVWVTEFGIAPKDIRRAWPTDDPAWDAPRIAAEWERTAREAFAVGARRAYGYCLDADEGAGYGIAGTPTADWLQRTQGGTV